ncbi:MAG: MBOAT family O-acyltransferase [Actinomycetota bacterium]
MLFPTYQFLVFFIIIFSFGISLKRKVGLYKLFLLVSSLVFYSFWSLQFLALLVASTVVNYLILLGLSRAQSTKKLFLILGITVNCLYLGIFKYYNFFADALFDLLNAIKLQWSFQTIQILVPVGVSFYTFRMIAHLVDCYHLKIACPKFLDYATYITYFPQIAAGPIARPKEFYQQLNSPHKYDYQIEEALVLILSGLFKKYTLSSFLFNFTELPFSSPQQYSSIDLFLAAIAYSCLIYVDFSGYSDLANGISCLLGFAPIQNFKMPYCSLSLQEFWRRWHISLSEWLRDYIYISLGGNQQGKFRKYLNLFLTLSIGGFWHGAGLNFIIWGSLHGLGLVVNHAVKDLKLNFFAVKEGSLKSIAIKIFNWFLTFTFITLTWVIFKIKTWENAELFLRGFFQSYNLNFQFNFWQLYLVIFMVYWMNFYGQQIQIICLRIFSLRNIFFRVVLVSACVYAILRLGPSTVPPFIYFNF